METQFIKKGGSYRAVLLGAVDEDTFTVPIGMKIINIVTKQNTTTDGNLELGTSANGDEVVSIVALGGTEDAIAIQTIVLGLFSLTASQVVHLTISSSTDIDLFVTMQKVN